MRSASLAGVLAAALAVAGGCGGGGGKQAAMTTGSGPAAVSMQGLRFHPRAVTVHVGQSVVWTNNDTVDHNVTATAGASFHTSAFGQGRTFRFTPTRPGTVRFVCTLHPGMAGAITVTR